MTNRASQRTFDYMNYENRTPYTRPRILNNQTSTFSSIIDRTGLIMHLRAQTWTAQFNELFDYETPDIVSIEYKCDCMHNSYYVLRSGNDVQSLPRNEALEIYNSNSDVEILVCIDIAKDGSLRVSPPPINPPQPNVEQELWLVTRCLRNFSVLVHEGDHLKLGRYELRIRKVVRNSNCTQFSRSNSSDNDDRETVVPSDQVESLEGINSYKLQLQASIQDSIDIPQAESITHNPVNYKLTPDFTSPICRICLSQAHEKDQLSGSFNPLVAPCECKGSMEWTHLKCLKSWIFGRLNFRQDSREFIWKSLSCELCRNTYPSDVRIHCDSNSLRSKKITTKKINLIQSIIPYSSYIIIEPVNTVQKYLQIIKLSSHYPIRLGRGHESNIHLADISVSRLHSSLHYDKIYSKEILSKDLMTSNGILDIENRDNQEMIILEDHRSKFGTLLQLKTPFCINTNYPAVSLQIGRTVLTLCIRRRWRLKIPTCIL